MLFFLQMSSLPGILCFFLLFNLLLLALLTLTLGLTNLMVEAKRLALWWRFYRPSYLCFWSHLCSDRHDEECKIKSAV